MAFQAVCRVEVERRKYAYDHFIALFIYESFMTVNCGFGFSTANEMNFRWTDIDFDFLLFANSFD